MGLTERHWFEDEEPELTERQLEDAVSIQDRIYRRGYNKGYSDGVKEQKYEYEKGFNDAMHGKHELMYEGMDGKWHKKDW